MPPPPVSGFLFPLSMRFSRGFTGRGRSTCCMPVLARQRNVCFSGAAVAAAVVVVASLQLALAVL